MVETKKDDYIKLAEKVLDDSDKFFVKYSSESGDLLIDKDSLRDISMIIKEGLAISNHIVENNLYSDDTYMTLRPSDAERAALYTKAHEHLKAVMDKGIHKMNPSFADEWEKSDLIRFESISLKDVNKRLNSVYVWCEEYLNLQTNTLSFDDTHPLVLDVHN